MELAEAERTSFQIHSFNTQVTGGVSLAKEKQPKLTCGRVSAADSSFIAGNGTDPVGEDGFGQPAVQLICGLDRRHVLLGLLPWLTFLAFAMFRHPERAWPLVVVTILVLARQAGALSVLLAALQKRLALVCNDRSLHRIGTSTTCLAVIIVSMVLAYEISKDFRKLQPLLGICVLLGCCAGASTSRKHIEWSLILRGFIVQFFLAGFIMRTQMGYSLFQATGDAMARFLEHSDKGAAFVFGGSPFVLATLDAANTAVPFPPFKVHFFAFKVLPTTIFFSAFVSSMYFLGVLQAIVSGLSLVLRVVLGTSPLESVSSVGNIFLGMTEAPLLVKTFLPAATKSEVHAVMTSGFATIAGSVMAVYISMGISPLQLLAASVMSAPTALIVSKLICPETEEFKDTGEMQSARGTPSPRGPPDLQMPEPVEKNIIEAAGNGASAAIGLVANIGAMLIAFLSLISVLNGTLSYLGGLVDLPGLSFEKICSYLFAPLAWLVGTPHTEVFIVGELLGAKIFVNEFVAYDKLASLKSAGMISAQGELAAAFSLCGFANLGSMGISLGGLTTLAPERKQVFAQLVFSAMLSGCVTSFLNACVASILREPGTEH